MGRLSWQIATVTDAFTETPRAKTLVLWVPGWGGHLPGQHVDVRLTAEDGYQAQRSYSIASAPDGQQVALTVERLPDGEVSAYLTGELRPGDGLELRGPIGGYFTWDVGNGGPLFLVGGGSGIVPLMAMIRHHVRTSSSIPVRLLYSSRAFDEIIYRHELEQIANPQLNIEVSYSLTRAAPEGWSGFSRRIDGQMLAEAGWLPDDKPLIYVCGPTGMVESVASLLVSAGHDPLRIRTERFGPTGG